MHAGRRNVLLGTGAARDMIEVRELKKEEWSPAMGLAWRTFLKYDAKSCDRDGINSFFRFVTDADLEKMFLIGEYKAFGAFEDGEIVGVSGVRSGNFLSILFVDEKYHRRGIGTRLVAAAAQYIYDENHRNTMLVYSARGATEFYHRLGFVDIDSERHEAGMFFIPMELKIR